MAPCWPQGQPAAATAGISWNTAGASSVLRLSEDQIQRKPERNNLVQDTATQCKIHPCSEAERKTEGGKARPFCAAAPFFPSCWHTADPASDPLCSSVPLRRQLAHPCEAHAAAARRAASQAACANACAGCQLATEKLVHPETSAHTAC